MVLGVVAATSAQLVDDFSCPDEFAGYYPHLIRQAWMCMSCMLELLSGNLFPTSHQFRPRGQFLG